MKKCVRSGFAVLLFSMLFLANDFSAYANDKVKTAEFKSHNQLVRIHYTVNEKQGNFKIFVTDTDANAAVLVDKDGDGYFYRLEPGERATIPLANGNGVYKITVYLHVDDTLYEEIWSTDADIRLENWLEPFLASSKMVSWSGDSPLAQKAANLSDGKTREEAALAICDYIASSYSYCDWVPPANYVPDPDDVFGTNTGICYDIATLYTAMCRSAGIPCMLVTGFSQYMGPDKYHAWCEVYINGSWRMVDPLYSMEAGAKFLDRDKTVKKYIF